MYSLKISNKQHYSGAGTLDKKLGWNPNCEQSLWIYKGGCYENIE